jgi:hypothetical protein
MSLKARVLHVAAIVGILCMPVFALPAFAGHAPTLAPLQTPSMPPFSPGPSPAPARAAGRHHDSQGRGLDREEVQPARRRGERRLQRRRGRERRGMAGQRARG